MLVQELDFVHHFRPAARPYRRTALLLLHGTGGDETSLLPLGHDLSPGAALLSARGRVFDGLGNRYFRRGGFAPFEAREVRRRAAELARFVRAAAGAYRLRRRRTVAVGYSNGANMAAGLLLYRPRLFRTAVLFRAVLPVRPAAEPDLSHLSVFVAGGWQERPEYQDMTGRLAWFLRKAGARVCLRWEAAGHDVAPQEVAAAREWLEAQGL